MVKWSFVSPSLHTSYSDQQATLMPLFLRRIFYVSIPNNRIYGLDILRALAILWVMIGHGNYFLPEQCAKYIGLIVLDGVSVFFVLSGFLIGGILIKLLENQPANGRLLISFWVKRWMRTVPPYFLALFIAMTISFRFPDFRFSYYKEYFLFLQNFKSSQYVFFNFNEAWSLSIEEWFYLLVPVVTILFIKFGAKAKHSVVLVTVLVVVSVTAYRYYKFLYFPPQNQSEWACNFRNVVLTRLDSPMYGVIAAYLSYYTKGWWTSYQLPKLLLGLALLGLEKLPLEVNEIGLYNSVFSFSITSAGALFCLPFLTSIKTGTGWLFQLLTRISLISYSIYLLNLSIVQYGIITAVMRKSGLEGGAYSAVAYPSFWALTLIMAVLMYNYFEVPVMQLRNRLVSKKEPDRIVVA